jgi:integrase
MVHWQAGDRPLPAQQVTVSGESALWVDHAEIPSGSDIGKLGRALAEGRHGERDELMASTAAYSALRWGELTALTIWQVDQAGRVITVNRQVVEVAGHLYVEAPKCRKYRKTIYPRRTPDGYPLAEKLAAEGLTDKQIGERLFLSHRTVSTHLYQLFPKLGITSRAAFREALKSVRTGKADSHP